MFTKKILALLLGISVLSCADEGSQARVERFLQKPNYQVEFGKLSDAEKKQLASDLNECFDKLAGVAVKKANLKRLCEPYLDKGDKAKALLDVTSGQKKKQYEDAAAVKYAGPAQKEVGRIHNVINKEDAIIAPPKQVVRVEGSIADKLKFFQEQSAQLQKAIAQKDIEKPNPRLVALKVDLDGLKAPLEDARSAFERATTARLEAEALNKQAADSAASAIESEKQAIDNEHLATESEKRSKEDADSAASAAAMFDGRQDAEVDAIMRNEVKREDKKSELFEKYGITQENAVAKIVELDGKPATAWDALLVCRILIEDYLSKSKAALEAAKLAHEKAAKAREEAILTRERSEKTKAEVEELLRQATLGEADADRILKDLDSKYQAIASEIASLK